MLVKKICNFYLSENITAANGSGGSRGWPKAIIEILMPRPAVDNFPKGLAKVVAEESVEYGINAAVGVCQYVAGNLDHYGGCGQWKQVQRFYH